LRFIELESNKLKLLLCLSVSRRRVWCVKVKLHFFFPIRDDSIHMAQAVICRPSSAEIRVNSKVTPCEICGRRSDNGKDLVLSISVFPYHYHPTSSPSPFPFIISHRLCIMLEIETAIKQHNWRRWRKVACRSEPTLTSATQHPVPPESESGRSLVNYHKLVIRMCVKLTCSKNIPYRFTTSVILN